MLTKETDPFKKSFESKYKHVRQAEHTRMSEYQSINYTAYIEKRHFSAILVTMYFYSKSVIKD